jgi:S1-C subfamily serine protease
MDALGQPAARKSFGIRVAEIRYSYNLANERSGTTYIDEHGRIIPVEVECQAIAPGSTAERIGLAPGDWLLSYDGELVHSTPQLIAIIDHAAPGVHRLTVRRGGATTAYEVQQGKLGVSIGDALAARQCSGAPLPSPP